MWIFQLCYFSSKSKIFFKRKWIYLKGNISPCKICRNLWRHHTWIGTGNIYVHIIFAQKRIYNFLPSTYFLNFIQKKICSALSTQSCFYRLKHLLCSHIFIFHRIKPHRDNIFFWNVPLIFKLIHDHLHNCGFSWSPNPYKHFYKRTIHICHDLIHVKWPIDHTNRLRNYIVPRLLCVSNDVLRL